MAFYPTTAVLDDFNRPNTGPPPSASWTNDMRASGKPGLAVVGGMARGLVTGEQSSFWNTVFGKQNEVWVTLGPQSALPTTGLLDNFNRADGSLGANWVNDLAAQNLDSAMAVASNRCQKNGPAVGNAYWSGATFGNDCEVYATVGVPGTSMQLYARGTGFGTTAAKGYYAAWTASGVQLFRFTGGTITALGTLASTAPLQPGDKIGLRCVGSTIEAWWKLSIGSWQLVKSTTDSTYPTGGQIGLGTSTTSASFDDFSGGTVVPGLDPGASPNLEFEIWGRGTQFAGALPQAYVVYYRGSDGLVRLEKYGPGGVAWYTVLSAPEATFLMLEGDSLGLRCMGSSIEAWGKRAAGSWQLLTSAIDTQFSSGGQIGLLVQGSTRRFDSFGGGSAMLTLDGSIAPVGVPKWSIARRFTGAATSVGLTTKVMKKAAPFAGAISSVTGALATAKKFAPIVIPLTKYPAGMDEMLYATLPFPEAQAQLGAPGVDVTNITASCGWHGTSFDPWRGSFAIVARDGPLAEMVGERLAVTRRDLATPRTVYVYVHSDSDDLTEDVSLTRRAFMELGDPALDNISVVCDVVGPSVVM
jgi:hypothetical protein